MQPSAPEDVQRYANRTEVGYGKSDACWIPRAEAFVAMTVEAGTDPAIVWLKPLRPLDSY
jgi:hypothetical protein